ncbi:hypothetical protein GCM10010112_55960 [Actinoplanes lobatus]|uniref:Uncharacterized protein n=1 Tax=Actinoplanes lobatus TaxID=113568 RepID=A0ABQ4AWM3_9ACTN|nr:hypothetical protein GCM10010112_55960 [Actinoplanes lobatus]GIE45256.1 hypothetical protein Alo02nite_81540 [Actinoplanes lobatus]
MAQHSLDRFDVRALRYGQAGDEGDAGDQFVQQARAWFDSIWDTITHEYTP